MSEFIKVGAGWKAKSGKGYNCKIEIAIEAGQRIMIFSNKKKNSDKHPDIILGYFEDDESKQTERDQRQNEPPPPTDDDIPF